MWQLERVPKKLDKQIKGTQTNMAHKMEPKNSTRFDFKIKKTAPLK